MLIPALAVREWTRRETVLRRVRAPYPVTVTVCTPESVIQQLTLYGYALPTVSPLAIWIGIFPGRGKLIGDGFTKGHVCPGIALMVHVPGIPVKVT